ncbi:MAG: tRNA dihydrouridine synthase DusB [Spirochaetia bacterium]|nr:tRNA dihydrouridine synthase DusB [Spirochaetia bacterium]
MKNFYNKFKKPFTALSPMAGYTDSPFRILCKRMGSAISVTEFVSTEAIKRNSEKTLKILRYEEIERPVVFQVFGTDSDTIAESCKKIETLKPDGIELNLGCSVKKIALKGAGAGLLREPDKVKKIISNMVKVLKVPVSAKIRLGWDLQSKNYLEIGFILEGEGASAVTLHARTRSMGYGGKADWEAIGNLKRKISIPVFGNGDITSLNEAHEKIRIFNVDGVFIGRAAIGNPWIFSGKEINKISYEQRLNLIIEHIHLSNLFYGKESGVIKFRKHLVKYLKNVPHAKKIKNDALKVTESDELIYLLKEYN